LVEIFRRVKKAAEQVRCSVAIAIPAQKPDTAFSDHPTPVGAGQAPALEERPLPGKRQAADASDLTLKDALYLDVAPLVPSVQPGELEISVQGSYNDRVRIREATGR
jgi:hypothetical protein